MTPLLLFQYILAVVCGIGLGVVICLFVFALFFDAP